MKFAPFFILSCLIFSCGGIAVNPDHDADVPVDPCDCPTGDLLAEHFARQFLTETVYSNTQRIQGMHCDSFPDWLVVGGGCWHEPFIPNMSLSNSGLDSDTVGVYTWDCRWYNYTIYDLTMRTSGLCMAPTVSREVPAECACPSVQAFRDRLYWVDRLAPLVPEQPDNTLVVACDSGDVLLTGGCTTSIDVSPLHVKLSNAGFDPEDPDAWKCIWNHMGGPTVGIMQATIMCMRPPDEAHAPETEPLANRIIRRSSSRYLDAVLTATTDRVACSSDEFVLGGSCVLDNTEPSSYQSFLNVFSEDYFIPNAWRCGWYETTDNVAIEAITTAICLRPPNR
jgi:hypothetical protein